MAAPTRVGGSGSGIGTSTRATGSLSWSTGDVVFVLGITADNSYTLSTPTTAGSGLTFAAVSSTPTNVASSCKAYAWTATASASSSGTISSSVTPSSNHGAIIAWVYSGSDGLGATAISAALGSTTTQNLTRGQANSMVVQIWGDWNAVNDTTVTWTPTGETQMLAQFQTGQMTSFGADWGDQGGTGTTAYGFSGFAGGDMTAITLEVKGTAAGGGSTILRQMMQHHHYRRPMKRTDAGLVLPTHREVLRDWKRAA